MKKPKIDDLIRFLEWLDVSQEVAAWGDPEASHEDTAKRYLADEDA